MNMFRAFARRRSLRRYALDLPRRLTLDHGGTGPFTLAQIDSAIGKLGLDRRLAPYAHAMFLAPESFDALYRGARGQPVYADMRAEMAEYAAHTPSAGSGFYESGLGQPDASPTVDTNTI